jgi:hypothetical protein
MRKLIVLALCLAPLGCAEKVDCGKLAKKLDECGVQMVKAIATEQGQKLEGSMADSMIGAMLPAVKDPLNKECTDNGGKFSDAKQVNDCLAKTSCDEFAACMAKNSQ